MAIHVSCPDCGKDYTLADSVRGRKVRCKECGGVIEVVDSGFAAGPARSAPSRSPSRPPSRPSAAKAPARPAPARRSRDEDDDDDRGGSSGFPKWAWGALGGLVVVALLATVGLIFLLQSDATQQVAQNPPPDQGVQPIANPPIGNPPVANPPVANPPIANPPIANPPVVVPPVQPPVQPKPKPPVVAPVQPPVQPPVVGPVDPPVVGPVNPPVVGPVDPPVGKVNPPVVGPVNPPVVGPVNPPVGKQPVRPVRPPVGGVDPKDPFGIAPLGGLNWTAKADPGAAELKAPAKSSPFTLANGSTVVFPSTESEFVAVKTPGPNGTTTWTSLNLSTMKALGALQGKINLNNPAVSPDGKYLVGSVGGAFEKDTNVYIFSLPEAKLAKTLTMTEKERPHYFDFGPDGKIITGSFRWSSDCFVQVWDPATGEPIAKVDMRGTIEEKRVAMSPGRKYLVVSPTDAHNTGITIIETTTGAVAGKIPGTGAERSEKSYVAFSQDGKELAVFHEGQKSSIHVYNFDTGERTAEINFVNNPNSFFAPWGPPAHARPIEFTPDKSSFLVYGEILTTNPGGSMYYKLPRLGEEMPHRRWFGPDNMVQFGKGALQIVPMPRTTIAALVKKAAATEEARAQLELPPTKTADLATAVAIADSSGATPWKAAVTSTLPGEKARTFTSVKTRFGPDKTIDFQIAGAKSAQAVGITRDTLDPLAGKDLVMADRYDLATGKHLGVIPLFPADGAKSRNPIASLRGNAADGIKLDAEVSPDGLMLACRRDAEPNRIDLWNLGTAKHIGAFTPHDNAPIDSFVLLDGGKLWTSGGGDLTLWQVPELKALAKGSGWKGKILVTPSQKHIVVCNGRRLELLDAATGQLLGSFADHPAAESILAGFFPQSGKEFVAAISNGREHALAKWDLAKGSLTVALPVEKLSPENADKQRVIGYASPMHVYFDSHLYAWNFPTSPLLAFQTGWPHHIRATNTTPDGSFRVFAKDNLVVPVLISKDTDLLTTRLPAAEKVTPPGSKFTVQVTGGDPAYQETAKKNFQAEVERLGHVYGEGGFQAFVDAQIKQTGTGKYGVTAAGPPFGPFGFGPKMGGPKSKYGGDEFLPGGPGKGGPGGGATNVIEIPLNELTVSIRVVDQTGKEVYKNVNVGRTPDRFTQKTNNPDQELREMLWNTTGVPSIAPLARRYRIDGRTFDLPAPANFGF